MPTRLPRSCLTCGTLTQATRCTPCEARRQSLRNAARPHYRGPWPAISRAARRAQPWCTDCATPLDLTTDHVTPRSLEGGVDVVCRACNAKRRWSRRT